MASWVSRAKRAAKATPEDRDALIARLTAENAAAVAGVISDNRTEHNIPHTVSCRAQGVSESWFYK